MIEIRRIKPDEWLVAKRMIYRVAHDLFGDPLPLEESITHFEIRGELKDMDDIQENYFNNGGTFLVMTNDGQIIGTGAIRKLEERVCELKRLWLLTEYQGKGLGYRLIMELLHMAREMGYQKIRLETDPVYQKHAIDFYTRLGFYPIPHYDPSDDTDIAMELVL